MKYTKGKWDVYQDNMAQITSVVSEDGVGFFHKTIATMNRQENNYESTAKLITTAVNACISVNPENPLAVAESIKDMYEALKDMHKALTVSDIPLVSIMQKYKQLRTVLTKLEVQ